MKHETSTREKKEKMIVCHFKEWLNSWWDSFESYDSGVFFNSNIQILKDSVNYINLLLSKAEENVIKEKTPKESVKKLEELHNKEYYINLQKISENLLRLIYDLEKYRDLNNKKTEDLLELQRKLSVQNGNDFGRI